MDSTSAPLRLRAQPSWLLNQAATAAQRLVGEGLAAVGAHRYHYSVLSALDEVGPASQAELGRRCGIDRSDMVAVVNRLTGDGLVERTPDAVDRRRNLVSITAAGRRRLGDLDSLLARIQQDLLAPLPAADRERLVRMLTAMVDHHARA